MKTPKANKALFTFLKILLFAVLVGLIYWQIKARTTEVNLWQAFKIGFSWNRFPFLLLAVCLMPVNIFIESLKWKELITQFQEDFDITDALKSMLCGSFFGFISPNRVGEFLGRLHRIDTDKKSRALTAGYWGGIAQFIVTFSVGIYMGGRTVVNFIPINTVQQYTTFFAIAVVFFASAIYFNLKQVLQFLSRFPYFKKITDKYPLEFDMPAGKLVVILLFTLIRYMIYVTQYIYLLFFFGVELSYEVLFEAVSTMLIIHTVVPSVPFVDLGIKGNVLVLLLKKYTFNELGILLAVFTIWLINIIIPAVVGYFYFISAKSQNKLNPN